MKKLMLVAVIGGIAYQAAKYLGINSFKDLKKMVMPHVKDLKGLVTA